MKSLRTILIISNVFLWSACSTPSPENNQQSEQPENEEINAEISQNKQGENLYLRYCMACHQTDGSGVPGMYPPLIKSPTVNSGNKNDFINVLLNGLKGPIEVHGKKYNQQMPKQDFLTDEELSLIINYVSQSFKNNGASVTPNDIKAQRKSASE